MRINRDSFAGYRIRAYGDGGVVVDDTTISRSIILTPERIIDWPPASFDELAEAHFDAINALTPELVLLGTGPRQQFPSPALTRALTDSGIGVEVMNTAAACRTYNILMAEGRHVAAALLLC